MKSFRPEKKRIFEEGIHYWLEKLFDAVTLNLLWLLFSLPVVTVGASSAAFYHCFVKVLRSERGRLFPEFWKSFTGNLGKGVIVSIVFAALLFVLLLNRNIAADIGGIYTSLFLICFYTFLCVMLAAVMFYFIAVLSRFEMSFIETLKLSLYMCFRYFPRTLLLLGISGAAGITIYYIPPLVFCIPVFALYPFSLVMEKNLIRHTPLPSGGENSGDEQKWYFNLVLKDGINKPASK